MKEILFYLYTLKKVTKNSTELRASFLVSVIGMVINNCAFVLMWVALSMQTGIINGWTSADVIGMLGFSTLTFGFIFFIASGLRAIPQYVFNGSLDQFLLNPKSLLIRTVTSKFDASTIGDIVFGILCLTVFSVLRHLNLLQIGALVLCIIFANIIQFSFVLIINSISFYFTDGKSISQSLSELFLTPSLFHGGAFQGSLRFFFIFIVPSLAVATIPIEAIRDLSVSKIGLLFILSIFWFFLSLWFFKKSVKRYESANFMTFGQ